MKKNILAFILILSAIMMSCSSDKDYVAPQIEGSWTTVSRVLKTNYPVRDQTINKYFQEHLYNREFDDKTFHMTIERPLSGDESKVIYDYTYSYVLNQDTMIINNSKKAHVILTHKVLTTIQEVDRDEIGTYLVQLGVGTVQTLPADIKGTLWIKESR